MNKAHGPSECFHPSLPGRGLPDGMCRGTQAPCNYEVLPGSLTGGHVLCTLSSVPLGAGHGA